MGRRPDVSVLVHGELHEHAVSRLEAVFEICRARGARPADLPRSIRGIAADTTVDAPLIRALPHLEIIAVFGAGYERVDVAAARARGVVVTNTPGPPAEEVADTAIGLLINTVRELPRAEAWLREGRWISQGEYPLTPATLRGRRAGIFGLGRIGRAIATRLLAFGIPVAYHNRRPVPDLPHQWYASLLDLAGAVDILICAVPGGHETLRAVDAPVLSALGPDGILINVGRGSIVDEDALVAALSSGVIRAAGLDVFAHEPHVPEALLQLPNACLLPHVGTASEHTRRQMADLVVDNLVSWFESRTLLTPV